MLCLQKLINTLEFTIFYPSVRLVNIVFLILCASLAKTYQHTGVYETLIDVVRNTAKKLALMCFSCVRSAQHINYTYAEQKICRATLLEVTFLQHLVISQKITFQRNVILKF